MITLDSKVSEVVGGRTATGLEKAFGMQTVRDLLSHYPRRLAERGELTPLHLLPLDEEVTVVAEVQAVQTYGPRRHNKDGRLEVIVGDGRSTLQLVFFGRGQWRGRELQPGVRGLFSGKVGIFRDRRQLVHPEFLILRGDGLDDLTADDYAGQLIPVYPATQQVRSWVIANAVKQALVMLDELPDPLEPEVRARRGLLGTDAAVRAIHRPESREQWYAARKRLAWDEALGVQLRVLADDETLGNDDAAVNDDVLETCTLAYLHIRQNYGVLDRCIRMDVHTCEQQGALDRGAGDDATAGDQR